jgi:hypothetical protein
VTARLVWRWRRWRARHFVWQADLAYRRWPTPAADAAWARAVEQYQRVEINRP